MSLKVSIAYSGDNTLGTVPTDEGQRPQALAYFGDLDTRGLDLEQ